MREILVIDDSPTVRKLIEISLRGQPLRPHFAETGAEGIRRAAALAPAAILLDFMLPDMTGVDVCHALMADIRTRTIPILLVTAKHERTRSQFQAFSSVVDFVAKPFAVPDLIARIQRAIGAPATPAAGRSGAARRDPTERAAKLLFGRLRDGLALIPTQLGVLEPGAVAPQLARHLLTPQVVADILADLRPLYAELAASEAAGQIAEPSLADEPLAADAIVDRAPGFSAKVAAAQLSTLDRRILALADGRTQLAEIARRMAVDLIAVASAARGLIRRGLVHEAPVVERPRPVVICEPDVEAFQQPLRSLLAHRATARELIAVDRVDEVLGVIRQQRPCLVMLNATARVAEACAVAQVLRKDLALPDLAIVAVLEPRVGPAPDLLTAGFDAVLTKPVMVHDLERFLIPADLR